MAQDPKIRQVFNDIKAANTPQQYAAIMNIWELLVPAGRAEDTGWYMGLQAAERDGGFFFPSGVFNRVTARLERQGNAADRMLLEAYEFEGLGQNNKFQFNVPTLRVWVSASPDMTCPSREYTEQEMEKLINDAKAVGHQNHLVAVARQLAPAYHRVSMDAQLRKLVGVKF